MDWMRVRGFWLYAMRLWGSVEAFSRVREVGAYKRVKEISGGRNAVNAFRHLPCPTAPSVMGSSKSE